MLYNIVFNTFFIAPGIARGMHAMHVTVFYG
jgi:hypothetical protein